MKFLLAFVLLVGVSAAGFSKDYEALSPEKRMQLANDWLETGKAYQSSQKLNKAKACFTYVNDVYPMGAAALEARKILKDSFNLNLSYNPDGQFSAYARKGDMGDGLVKINQYLMALEIKQDKAVLHKVAIAYKAMNNDVKAKEYLDKAIAAGLAPESVHKSLKSL